MNGHAAGPVARVGNRSYEMVCECGALICKSLRREVLQRHAEHVDKSRQIEERKTMDDQPLAFSHCAHCEQIIRQETPEGQWLRRGPGGLLVECPSGRHEPTRVIRRPA